MKKKIFAFSGGAVLKSCVFFTAVSLVLYIGAYVSVGNTGAMTLGRVMFVLIFSVVCGAATQFLTADALNLPIRAVIHYAVTLAAFLILFPFIAENAGGGKGMGAVITVAIYTLCWAIPFAIWLAVRNNKRKRS